MAKMHPAKMKVCHLAKGIISMKSGGEMANAIEVAISINTYRENGINTVMKADQRRKRRGVTDMKAYENLRPEIGNAVISAISRISSSQCVAISKPI
jgi:hypothetical protein